MTREYFVFMCGSMAWVWEFSLEVNIKSIKRILNIFSSGMTMSLKVKKRQNLNFHQFCSRFVTKYFEIAFLRDYYNLVLCYVMLSYFLRKISGYIENL